MWRRFRSTRAALSPPRLFAGAVIKNGNEMFGW